MTHSNKKYPNGYVYLAVMLGMLTAFAPFVTDFYLPSLPFLAEYFSTSPSAVQMSLTTSMLGLALGQIIIGPVSDKYGRKPLLIFALAAFFLTTVLCIFAPNVHMFNLSRLLQGMSAAGGLVTARSVTTDSFRGRLLSKFLALVSAVNGIAPVTAPVLGGIFLKFTSWKGIFVALMGVDIALLVLALCFTETLSPRRRTPKSLVSTFTLYGKVLQNGEYLRFLLPYMLSQFVLFSYISASPFLFQVGYGFSPVKFSLFFAINALAIGIGSALSGKFRDDFSALKFGAALMTAASVAVLCLLFAKASPLLLEISLSATLFSFGIMQPPVTAQTLRTERANGGTASALMGALGFAMGSVASPLVGIGDTFKTAGITVFAGSLLTLLTVLAAVSSHFQKREDEIPRKK